MRKSGFLKAKYKEMKDDLGPLHIALDDDV